MFTGFYTAAAGLLTQQRAINVLTNNIVNEKTPGYQTERLVSTTFEYEYTLRRDAYGMTRIGGSAPTRLTEEVPVLMESGLMEETGRPLDMALDGKGFFNVLPDGGEVAYLTRNGNFQLDTEGYLYLHGIGRVQGQNGDIQLGTSDFTVTSDGTIYDAEGQEIDRLLLTWPGLDQVDRYENGLYVPKEGAENPQADDIRVAQGNLESSSVDINREMTEVMEANRALQACSTAMKMIDEINQKAAGQIAKL